MASTIFVPEIFSEHVQLGLVDSSDPNIAVDNRAFNQLRQSGAVIIEPADLSVLSQGGDFVSVPSVNDPADLERADVTTTTDLTPAEVATSTDVAVIQRQKKVYQFKRSDAIRSGFDHSVEFSRKLGGKLAKRAFSNLMRVAIGAVDACDTTSPGNNSADCHTLSVYSATTPVYPSIEYIRQAKQLLCDAQGALNTCCLDSVSFGKLLYDLIENYGGFPSADSGLISGMLGKLLGIENWVISDLVPTTANGTNPAKHNILLLGPGALWYAHQQEPTVETQKNILKPTTYEYMSVEIATVQHLRWIKYNDSGANPTDAYLADVTKYDEVYEDHRRVLCAKLVTN